MAEDYSRVMKTVLNNLFLSLGNGNDCRNIFVIDGRGRCLLDDDSGY